MLTFFVPSLRAGLIVCERRVVKLYNVIRRGRSMRRRQKAQSAFSFAASLKQILRIIFWQNYTPDHAESSMTTSLKESVWQGYKILRSCRHRHALNISSKFSTRSRGYGNAKRRRITEYINRVFIMLLLQQQSE
jgi:hypothetical protein